MLRRDGALAAGVNVPAGPASGPAGPDAAGPDRRSGPPRPPAVRASAPPPRSGRPRRQRGRRLGHDVLIGPDLGTICCFVLEPSNLVCVVRYGWTLAFVTKLKPVLVFTGVDSPPDSLYR